MRWHRIRRTVRMAIHTRLPDWFIMRMDRRAVARGEFDPDDGWTYWMGVSYEKYVRHDMRLWG